MTLKLFICTSPPRRNSSSASIGSSSPIRVLQSHLRQIGPAYNSSSAFCTSNINCRALLDRARVIAAGRRFQLLLLFDGMRFAKLELAMTVLLQPYPRLSCSSDSPGAGLGYIFIISGFASSAVLGSKHSDRVNQHRSSASITGQ